MIEGPYCERRRGVQVGPLARRLAALTREAVGMGVRKATRSVDRSRRPSVADQPAGGSAASAAAVRAPRRARRARANGAPGHAFIAAIACGYAGESAA